MSGLVRNDAELDESKVAWPFTRKGTKVMLGVVTMIIVLTIVGLMSCQASSKCSENSWKSNFGVRDVPDVAGTSSNCERVDEGAFMGEVWNSLSNLAFNYVGLVLIAAGVADAVRMGTLFPLARAQEAPLGAHPRNHMVTFPLYSIFFGISCNLLGAFSFMFHAYDTKLTQQLDVGGIFIVLAASAGYMLLPFVSIELGRGQLLLARGLVVFLTALTGTMLLLFKFSISTKDVMFGFIGAIAIESLSLLAIRRSRLNYFGPSQRWRFRQIKLALLSAAVLAASWGIRTLGDATQSVSRCKPDSNFQFHALWHVGCAIPNILIYLFFRSEFITYPDEPENEELKTVITM